MTPAMQAAKKSLDEMVARVNEKLHTQFIVKVRGSRFALYEGELVIGSLYREVEFRRWLLGFYQGWERGRMQS